MKFTDIFIRRPVLATRGEPDAAGDRAAFGGAAAGAAVPAHAERRGHGADRLHRRGREPGGGLHHHAAGEFDRAGERHRLHDVLEHAQREHHHGEPAAQLRPRQGAHRNQHQGERGAQPAAAGLAAADPERENRPDDRRHVHRLRQRRAAAQQDHRLPGARGAAQAAGGGGRADRRDPRRQAVRAARLARPGEARRLRAHRRRRARRARRERLPLGGRQHQGADGAADPHRHAPACIRSTNSARWW